MAENGPIEGRPGFTQHRIATDGGGRAGAENIGVKRRHAGQCQNFAVARIQDDHAAPQFLSCRQARSRQRGFNEALDARINRQHNPIAPLCRFHPDLGDTDPAGINANCVAAWCPAQVVVQRVLDALLAGPVRLVVVKVFHFFVSGLLGSTAIAQEVGGE